MTEKDWLGENQLSLDIWSNKYRYKDETFEQWLDRVSGGNEKIKQLIREKKFLFGGRILANRGLKNRKVTYSNCYVLPAPEDNLESIFDCGKQLARTFSYGGGCGVDVSNLRPKGAKVNNAAKTTSGTTSFMDFFSYITGLIGQEGRRGATMLSIDCTHPDLEEFINLKSDLNICTKANISVRVSDQFMLAVIEDKDWMLYFETDSEIIEKKVNARKIFKLLAKRNWEMAEPGILFWDTICERNLLNTDSNFQYAGVNPCAEEPLSAGSSCLLGSLNLSAFVENPFTEQSTINLFKLKEAVIEAVNALNEVLDEGQELHPLKIQRDSVHDWRQIGLGTFGLGDMLIKLGSKYGSQFAIGYIDFLYKYIAQCAVHASLELAIEKGCYPNCNKEALVNSYFIKNLDLDQDTIELIKKHGLRNSQLLTCAPTGTTATMLQVSTGVEPNFAFSFNRKTVSLNEQETIYKVDADIVRQYREITGNQEKLPHYFISAHDIDPIDRVKMQAAIQKWIDASISSTVNLPESATIDDVFNLYIEAWKQGCKGLTIWRDNCQRQGILTIGEKESKLDEGRTPALLRGEIIKPGDHWLGLKRTLVTGCGTLHVESFWDPSTGELRECYLSKGSTGGCNNFMIGLSRMMSLAARGGVSVDNIIDQLKSCGTCPAYAVRTATKKDTSKGSCCPVAVGNALKDMHKEIQDIICACKDEKPSRTSELNPIDQAVVNKMVELAKAAVLEECPQCHERTLIHQGGCIQCNSCGYSKCN